VTNVGAVFYSDAPHVAAFLTAAASHGGDISHDELSS
jgi:hypothetical protein